jgi:hypothetical protein
MRDLLKVEVGRKRRAGWGKGGGGEEEKGGVGNDSAAEEARGKGKEESNYGIGRIFTF